MDRIDLPRGFDKCEVSADNFKIQISIRVGIINPHIHVRFFGAETGTIRAKYLNLEPCVIIGLARVPRIFAVFVLSISEFIPDKLNQLFPVLDILHVERYFLVFNLHVFVKLLKAG